MSQRKPFEPLDEMDARIDYHLPLVLRYDANAAIKSDHAYFEVRVRETERERDAARAETAALKATVNDPQQSYGNACKTIEELRSKLTEAELWLTDYEQLRIDYDAVVVELAAKLVESERVRAVMSRASRVLQSRYDSARELLTKYLKEDE